MKIYFDYLSKLNENKKPAKKRMNEDTRDRLLKARKDALSREFIMGQLGRECVRFAENFLRDKGMSAEVHYINHSIDRENMYVRDGDEIRFYKCYADVPGKEVREKLYKDFDNLKDDSKYEITNYSNFPSSTDVYKLAKDGIYKFVEVYGPVGKSMIRLYFHLWAILSTDDADKQSAQVARRYRTLQKESLSESFFTDSDWYKVFDRLCDAIAARLQAPFELQLTLRDEYGEIIDRVDIEGDEDGLSGY